MKFRNFQKKISKFSSTIEEFKYGQKKSQNCVFVIVTQWLGQETNFSQVESSIFNIFDKYR